jgi:hypothetical protein
MSCNGSGLKNAKLNDLRRRQQSAVFTICGVAGTGTVAKRRGPLGNFSNWGRTEDIMGGSHDPIKQSIVDPRWKMCLLMTDGKKGARWWLSIFFTATWAVMSLYNPCTKHSAASPSEMWSASVWTTIANHMQGYSAETTRNNSCTYECSIWSSITCQNIKLLTALNQINSYCVISGHSTIYINLHK